MVVFESIAPVLGGPDVVPIRVMTTLQTYRARARGKGTFLHRPNPAPSPMRAPQTLWGSGRPMCAEVGGPRGAPYLGVLVGMS